MLDILELRYINNCEKIVVFLKFERIKKKKYSFLLLLVFFKTWCILLQVFPPSYVKGFRIKKNSYTQTSVCLASGRLGVHIPTTTGLSRKNR